MGSFSFCGVQGRNYDGGHVNKRRFLECTLCRFLLCVSMHEKGEFFVVPRPYRRWDDAGEPESEAIFSRSRLYDLIAANSNPADNISLPDYPRMKLRIRFSMFVHRPNEKHFLKLPFLPPNDEMDFFGTCRIEYRCRGFHLFTAKTLFRNKVSLFNY